MTTLLSSFSIAGYRSFGPQPQHISRLSKVNILIGQNNSGKSNVLRFLKEVIGRGGQSVQLDQLAYHLPDRPDMILGVGQGPQSTDSIMARYPAKLRELGEERPRELIRSVLTAKACE